MNTYLIICGILFNLILVVFLYLTAFQNLKDFVVSKINNYRDYCYLSNLEMTNQEFDVWIKSTPVSERMKKHKWYYAWIPKLSKKSQLDTNQK